MTGLAKTAPDRLKLVSTGSNWTRPAQPDQTGPDRLTPAQTGPDRLKLVLKRFKPDSNRKRPAETGFDLLKPDLRGSNRIKPDQTGTNRIKADLTGSHRF